MRPAPAGVLLAAFVCLAACNDNALVPLPDRAPIAVIEADASEIGTLETAQLDGRDSYDPDGGPILQWSFAVVERPLGSSAQLQILSGGRAALFADAAGTYTVQLVVFDDEGIASEPAEVSFDAAAFEDIHVELSWDLDDTDVDLHFVNETLCQTGDCFAAHPFDCFWSNPRPDWGPLGSVGNPTLDLDDRDGFGPENINIYEPDDLAQTYGIQVNYYQTRGHGPATATVRIYLEGELQFEDTATLPRRGSTWNVAAITWPDARISRIGGVFDSGYPD